ncbi:MAG: YeeE/YedE family protein [Burkholderiales bacterium]
MTDLFHLAAVVAGLGFVLAFIFGAIANKAQFCTMGAISDIVHMGHWVRMRMWLLAIAVAMLGANLLSLMGLVDLSQSIYPRPRFIWLSHLIGGAFFGFGMVLASGCGNRTLVRIGGGSLKSLVVLAFLAISAYMTLKGLFGMARVNWIEPYALDFSAIGSQDLPAIAKYIFGATRASWQAIIAGVISVAIIWFVFKDRDFRAGFDSILGGIVIGLLVVAGWYVTGHIGYGENPDTLEQVFFGTNTRSPESFTFVAPVAYGLELLMLWSDSSLAVTFGVASVAGVILGSAAYALLSRTFRWESFADAADMRRHIAGGILMGFGGVTGLGCTIGQGITGLSTLALGSFVTFFAIVSGAVLAMKYLAWQVDRDSALSRA